MAQQFTALTLQDLSISGTLRALLRRANIRSIRDLMRAAVGTNGNLQQIHTMAGVPANVNFSVDQSARIMRALRALLEDQDLVDDSQQGEVAVFLQRMADNGYWPPDDDPPPDDADADDDDNVQPAPHNRGCWFWGVIVAGLLLGGLCLIVGLWFMGVDALGGIGDAFNEAACQLTGCGETQQVLAPPTPLPSLVPQEPPVSIGAPGGETPTAPEPTAQLPTAIPTEVPPDANPAPGQGGDSGTWAPDGWVHTRGDSQVPEACKELGMCPLAFDVAAGGVTLVIGSPMAFGDEARLYDASKGQAQIWAFTNPTTVTLSLVMQGWSGANAVNGWSTAEYRMPSVAELDLVIGYILGQGVDWLQEPGNCTIEGCKVIGYVVWECTGNDICVRKNSWNPVQDATDTSSLISAHAIIYGSTP